MRGMSSSRLITGGLIGAAIGMYAISQMSPRERKRIMRRGRKMLSTATRPWDEMNLF